jgi:fido (protein-threonine AMPylation protein)
VLNRAHRAADRCFKEVLERINGLAEPAEKALACLTLVPYLQPFTDGNKRTSRLLANAVLLAHDYPPVSFFTADETTYKASLVLFYEQGVLGNFRQLVTEQLEYSAERYSSNGGPSTGVPQLRPGKSPRIHAVSCGNGAEPGDGSCH